MITRCLVGLVLAWMSVVAAAQSAPVEFPQLGLAIQQPAGFERAQNFHGFQQAGTGSSLVLTLVPGPFKQVTAGFTKAGLASRGITLRSRQAIGVQGKPGLLLNVSQSANGQDYLKWIVVFGDASATRMVTATFPAAVATQLGESMKTAALSVSVREPVAVADDEPLPFSITAEDGLVKAKQVGIVGKLAAFTRDGRIPLARAEDPLFIVAPSLGEVPVQDRRGYAERRLRATAGTRIEDISYVNEVSIDGLSGFEFLAAGLDEKSGVPLAVYQVMLFQPDGGYILMTGLVGRAGSTEYLVKFRAMAQSFRGRAG